MIDNATAALRGARPASNPTPPARLEVAAPAVPRRVRLGMPQLDASGLSENWLFRHAGALHWEAIGQRLGVPADAIRSDSGERLYPTVAAVRARYQAPPAAHAEDDVIEFSVEVVPCGRACAHGRIVVAGRGRLTLEILTTFAARGPERLRTTHLAAALARRWTPAEGPEPAIAGAARAARRGARVDDPFCGPILGAEGPALGQLTYEPSPWADYNGAGLLYFASYVTIADTAAHRILRRRETGTNADWALATSPVQRDVYYYENLPLGAALTATLHLCEATDSGLVTRVRLGREDGRPMADVITRRAFTFMAGAGREAP